MVDNTNQGKYAATRSGPRAVAALDVEVEVAGERRKVRLVSQDIGAGGIFLRTDRPADLWTKVKLVLRLPAGGTFEVGGEVVRAVPKEKARAKGHPPGMAVAFDEVSRKRRKELVALVLDLCARRPEKEKEEKKEEKEKTTPPPTGRQPRQPQAQATDQTDEDRSTDALLDELDELLDSVESEIEVESKDAGEPAAEAAAEEIEEEDEDLFIEDVEVVDLGPPSLQPEAKRKPAPPPVPKPKPAPKPAPPARKKSSPQDLRKALANYKRGLKGDTYYDILGIGMKASAADIESAYQKLLGRLKPSGSPDSLPGDLLRELSVVLGKVRKAFAILSKPDRKRAYDFLIDNEVDNY